MKSIMKKAKYFIILGFILLCQGRINSQDLTFTEIKNSVLDHGAFYEKKFPSLGGSDWSSFRETLLDKNFVYVDKEISSFHLEISDNERSMDTECWAFNYNNQEKTSSIWIRFMESIFNFKSELAHSYKGIEIIFFNHSGRFSYLEDKIKQYCTFKKVADYTFIDNTFRRIYIHPDGVEFSLWSNARDNSYHIRVSHP